MSSLKALIFLAMLSFFLMACDETGYRISITTDNAKYDDVTFLETLLMNNGFEIAIYDAGSKGDMKEWRQRDVPVPKHPGEVYTLLTKTLSGEKYSWIEVYITYVKGLNDNVSQVGVHVVNLYTNRAAPQVLAEMQRVGDVVYQALSDLLGKDKVRIERKVLKSPVFM